MKRYAIYIVGAVLGIILVGTSISAYAFSGFIQSPLWLSPQTLKEGDMATLHVAFQNTEDLSVSANVSFFDGEVLLAKKTITAAPNQVVTATATFKVLAGEHSFSATITTMNRIKNGQSEPMAPPAGVAKLPDQFVSKKIDLSAQAGGGRSATESAILTQIDTAQTAVLNILPESVKESVGSIATNIDDWRQERGESFATTAKEAKKVADTGGATKTIKTNTILGSEDVTVSAEPTGSFTGPLSYIKYGFFKTLSWLFNTPIVFYLLIIVVGYFIARFLARKIGKIFNKKKGGKNE
ncbi:MAG: hypothetical protein KA052_00090 [Candidatus Pacebacteria bacterium]|nr:hypothetical protein [Candidatus Paceibacterota bacterium]